MTFSELIIFWFERSGFTPGELGVIFLSALILSPFPRLLLVLSAIRLGFNGFPGKFVCVGLALTLSLIQIESLLTPIAKRSAELSVQRGSLPLEAREQFLKTAESEWAKYVEQTTSPEVRDRFSRIEVKEATTNTQAVSTTAIPKLTFGRTASAFLVSELERALRASLVILLPLLIIELLTATAIAAMDVDVKAGLVSFPLKLALFISTSGWNLISETLLKING